MADVKKAKPVVAIRAGEIAKLASSGLGKKEKQWCETVASNNPPGQIVYADREMLERCQNPNQAKVKDGSDVSGQHEPGLDAIAKPVKGAKAP